MHLASKLLIKIIKYFKNQALLIDYFKLCNYYHYFIMFGTFFMVPN
jgi:hypothetical protein